MLPEQVFIGIQNELAYFTMMPHCPGCQQRVTAEKIYNGGTLVKVNNPQFNNVGIFVCGECQGDATGGKWAQAFERINRKVWDYAFFFHAPQPAEPE